MRSLLSSVLGALVILGLGETTALGDLGDLMHTFTNPGPSAGSFGISITVVGNNVLIGASGSDIGAPNAGAAYLFDGTTGGLLQTFLNPHPDRWEFFGRSVAAVGENVLIGCSLDHEAAQQAGAAYLFDASTGGLLQTFLNPTPQGRDYFGFSVAAVGNNVLIGAREDDTAGVDAGAAYLLDGTTRSPDPPVLLQTYLSPTLDHGGRFGFSVAAVGNDVLVGAPGVAQHDGAAYLFDGTTGGLLQTFLPPTPQVVGNLGSSVAAVGGNVLVGAPYDDLGATSAGAAYLFDATSGNLLRTFHNPTPASHDHFGEFVAALGDNVLIAAPDDDTAAHNAGAVYLFDGTTGGLLHTFLSPTPEESMWFGSTAAGLGQNVLVSDVVNDTVYQFQGIPEPPTVSLLTVGTLALLACAWRRRRRG